MIDGVEVYWKDGTTTVFKCNFVIYQENMVILQDTPSVAKVIIPLYWIKYCEIRRVDQ